MGGHVGAFINLKKGKCIINCGKKYAGNSVKEAKFYETLIQLVDKKLLPLKYLKFFPKFYSKYCTINKDVYFEIENLKIKAGKNAQILDFKIGFKTAYMFNSGFFKSKRHEIINQLSTSAKYGFRLEGSSVPISNAQNSQTISMKSFSSRSKFRYYSTNPISVFNSFFTTKKSILQAIKSLDDLITEFIIPNHKNALKNKLSIGFIGASVLFVSGEKSTFAKLIDFSHPVFLTPNTPIKLKENYLKVIINMTQGVLNLYDEIIKFSKQT